MTSSDSSDHAAVDRVEAGLNGYSHIRAGFEKGSIRRIAKEVLRASAPPANHSPRSFRKKPVVIDAWQVPEQWKSNGELISKIAAWCNGFIVGPPAGIEIETLEGVHLASPGDWIICGVAGEFYPCKPDIFEQTYEEVR